MLFHIPYHLKGRDKDKKLADAKTNIRFLGTLFEIEARVQYSQAQHVLHGL